MVTGFVGVPRLSLAGGCSCWRYKNPVLSDLLPVPWTWRGGCPVAIHTDNCEQGSLFLFDYRFLGVDFISFYFYIKDIEVDVFLKIL